MLFFIIGGVIILTCLCVGACLILGGTSFIKGFQEKPSIEKVIDSFMQAMVARDAEKAYELFSSRAKRQVKIESLEDMLEGNNYFLFEGYQNVSIININFTSSVNINPDVPQGFVVKVSGSVTYADGFTGSFTATLEKEGGQWYLDGINISVPPDKFPH